MKDTIIFIKMGHGKNTGISWDTSAQINNNMTVKFNLLLVWDFFKSRDFFG